MGSGGGNLSENALEEGQFLLGSPTFEEIENGRLRCVESGHELPAKEAEAYGRSKACRLSLIDAALAGKKPPLNMFKANPLCKSKLICKLTGDTVNKTEEHIWKHISGKRFLNKLKQKEQEKTGDVASHQEQDRSNKKIEKAGTKKDKKKKHVKDMTQAEPVSNERESEELDFWVPPVGDRWDCDDGKDRWDSCSSSNLGKVDNVEKDGAAAEEKMDDSDTADLSARTKRMSIAVGPSSSAPRKKKSRKNTDDKEGQGLHQKP